MSSTGLKIRQNRFRPGLPKQPILSWWEGGWLPPPQEPHPSLGRFGLELQPYGPRCLVPLLQPWWSVVIKLFVGLFVSISLETLV